VQRSRSSPRRAAARCFASRFSAWPRPRRRASRARRRRAMAAR
jgi:hypothetical protein